VIAPLALTLLLSHSAQAAAPTTARVEDTWDLTVLYPSVAAWEADLAATEKAADALAGCKGTLATQLRPCLDQRFAVQKSLMKVYTYASNWSNQDLRDAEWQARSQKAELLYARFAEVESFFKPELLALGSPAVEAAIKADPGMAQYDHYLRAALKDGEHTLDAAREALIAASSTVRSSSSQTRSLLIDAELPWPTVTLSDGSSARLNASGYVEHRVEPVRADRELVYKSFFGALKSFEGVLGSLLDGAVQGHWMVARAHNYPTSVAASIDRDHVPAAVYETLVKQTNQNLPTLHRYLRLRAQMLGITDLGYPDLYTSLVSGERQWTVDQAKALALKSAAPLGKEYTDALAEGLGARWTDVYPREGKRGGAYMDGAAYDFHPFLLLNYTGDYESVSTLAHEWGHAVHSMFSMRAQPYPKADYSTFIAEIASTCNEALLLETMLQGTKDDDEKLFYLGSALETLRGTYFRQAQLAEFEVAMHTLVEQGEPLTGATLTATYLDILKRYYGHDQGVTKIDDLYGIEWAYIPHFYYNFYVYQYATSIAASSLFAEDILAKKKGAVDRYLGLLEAGGSDDPYLLLKSAGVDLASPDPYDATARRMDKIMDQMEAILAKKAKDAKKKGK
jgi:oligoendopeptidase F